MADEKYLTALQPFLLLAKSATGRAAADLVLQATQAAGCFVFAELLETPNIQKLADSPDSLKYLELLKIFAYGSYVDYKANASALPSLNEKQLEKLKQLSLITIASRGPQYLTYSSLLHELDLPSVRALEDLVISAIYTDLLRAKLDTKSQFVEVSSTAGRDVAPIEIPSMIETLTRWCGQCEDVLADIDAQMKAVHEEAVQKKKESDEYEKLLAHKREQLRNEEKTSGALSKGKRVISEGDDGTRGGYDDDEMDLDDSPAGGDGHGSWGGANTSRRRTKGRFGGLMPGGPHKRR